MKIIYKIFRLVDIPHLAFQIHIDWADQTLSRSVLEDLPRDSPSAPESEHDTKEGAINELLTHPYFNQYDTERYEIVEIVEIKHKQ